MLILYIHNVDINIIKGKCDASLLVCEKNHIKKTENHRTETGTGTLAVNGDFLAPEQSELYSTVWMATETGSTRELDECEAEALTGACNLERTTGCAKTKGRVENAGASRFRRVQRPFTLQ